MNRAAYVSAASFADAQKGTGTMRNLRLGDFAKGRGQALSVLWSFLSAGCGVVITLIMGSSIATADTYSAPNVYWAQPANCIDLYLAGPRFPSGSAVSVACIDDVLAHAGSPGVILCTWWYHETGTQVWPEPNPNATLWGSSASGPGATCNPPPSGGYVADLHRTQSCAVGGTLNGTSCIDAAPCGQGQTRDANGVCAAKQTQCCSVVPVVGNPIQPALANKFEIQSDYSAGSASLLTFTRTYNSISTLVSSLGPQWRHSFDRTLQLQSGQSPQILYAFRDDGRVVPFRQSGSVWVADADVNDRITKTTNSYGYPTGWQYTVAIDDSNEFYDNTGFLLSITSRAGVSLQLTYGSGSYLYPSGAPACSPPSGTPAVPQGRLACVTDSFGRQLNFSYDTQNRLAAMYDPAGGKYQYAYDPSSGNLTTVTYPDSAVRTYIYNEAANTSGANLPYALTGITDENSTRYATFQFDTQGRATSTQLAGAAQKYTLSYGTNQTTVTDPLGTARTYSFSTVLGVSRNTAISQPCNVGCDGLGASTSYDANGNVASLIDFNGNLTCYAYDLTRNLETVRVEGFAPGSTCPSNLATYTPASGTRQRKIVTTWNASFRLPATITQFNRTTTLNYDGSGNLQTKTVTDTSVTPNVSRTWTYTYDSYGRMKTAKGPRTDVDTTTTYAYYTCTTGYQCGQLYTVTDALGHITTYNTYNAHGQPLTITDPNGVVTTLHYDARLRLTSRQVGTETTTFDYWPTGLLKKVTPPDDNFLTYTYDNAHRLTQITDGNGDYIVYTPDAMGNHTAEKAYDYQGVLHRSHTWVINALNQVYQDVNAAGTAAVTTTFGYDNNGNQKTIQAPLSRNTSNQYDELNRLTQITDPANGITKFGYDANDNLTSVTDPRTLGTSYTYNGFGDLKTQVSPDTGTTTNTYDSGGNLYTSTDARSAVATYTYDALNRIKTVAYSKGGTTDQTITFSYDQGTNGIGHLTGASDANHSMSWTYDPLGRVSSKSQTVGTVTKSVGYTYINGDLTTLNTPSGQTIGYDNTSGQVKIVTVNGATLLAAATYEPLGPVNGWIWDNGLSEVRSYNTDGNPAQVNAIEAHTFTFSSVEGHFRLPRASYRESYC